MFLDVRMEGVALTPDQAKALDDEFFLSKPLSHFSSRIVMLMNAAGDTAAPSPADQPDFFRALGLSSSETVLAFREEERQLDVAVDALALRHQAAEALTRFLYTVAAATPRSGDAPCTWLALADSPMRLDDVVAANKNAIEADPSKFLELLFPYGATIDDTALAAAQTAIAWVNHAALLLTSDELSINAAYNKVKHGLAIRTRGDVRIELITRAPDELGQIPLSSFGEGKSIPIFDRPMLTYLSRSKNAKPKQGLEAVSLRVEVPVVLAETWMMANVYAALFHVAARKHYGHPLPDGVASFPTLVVGRLPEHVIGGSPLGYRTPVTSPPDGITEARPSGLFFHGRFVPMRVDLDSKVEGIVTDG
ncbi:hypothetical protein [Cryobacterium sp. BB307]|uniref:hypothetical protein n=1 Tax=Cryobacterium sp. BB307 TaxID=2716317 RepID=UPI001444C593|nr:hypothetical protein [Cryobacterium sp. BB307]